MRRKADEWKALGEETTLDSDPARLFYVAIEVALRETADALEHEMEQAA